MANLFCLLAAGGKPPIDPGTPVVVAVGFGLVLVILTVMVLVLTLEGVIFKKIDEKKKGISTKAVASPTNAAAAVAPVIEAGIPAEVIAAIAAAIASMEAAEGSRFELRSVTREKTGRNAWNMAGTVSFTEPF